MPATPVTASCTHARGARRLDAGVAVVETALLVALLAVVCTAAVAGLGRAANRPLERLACASGARHAQVCNLVRNGDFEGFDFGGDRWRVFSAGAFAWPGWEVITGTVDLHSSVHNQASDGGTSVDLNGSGPGSLGVRVDTSHGEDLVLTFDVAENTTGGPDVKTATVGWGGRVLESFSIDTDQPMSNPGWTRMTVILPASASASDLLVFSGTTPNSTAGVMIDNVSVQPRSSAT